MTLVSASTVLGTRDSNRKEPAQKLALADGLYPKLVELLSESLTASTPYFGYLCRLLELLTESCMSKLPLQ